MQIFLFFLSFFYSLLEPQLVFQKLNAQTLKVYNYFYYYISTNLLKTLRWSVIIYLLYD